MFTKTLQDAKAFNKSEDTLKLAYEYIALKAKAEVTREAIDKIKMPIFLQHSFVEVMRDRQGNVRLNRPITDMKDVWLDDRDGYVEGFYKACNHAVAPEWRDRTLAEYGKDVLEGYCPALIAESTLSDHVTKCLEHMAAWMGVDVPINYKLRDQMFDLFMQGVFAKD
jgi:hypothetical protein